MALFETLLSTAYLVILAIGVVIGVWVTVLTQKQPPKPATRRFYYHSLASTVIIALYIGAAIFPPPLGEVFARLRFVPMTVLPVLWLLFILAYTGHEDWITTRYFRLLYVIPTISAITALIGPPSWFCVAWSSMPYGILHAEMMTFGGWYYVNLAFSYGVFVITVIWLAKQVFVSLPPYRTQAILFMAALCGAGIVIIPLTLGMSYHGLNLNPLTYIFALILYGIALYRYNLLRVMPVAYPMMFDHLHEAVMVVNTENQVVELNETAAQLLHVKRKQALGQPFEAVAPLFAPLLAHEEKGIPGSIEISTGDLTDPRVYEVRSVPLYRRGAQPIACAIMWQDITARRAAAAEREQLIKDLEAYSHTVAHDLKNPLNVVMGVNQLLNGELAATSPQIQQWLSLQWDTAAHMLKIIDNLLQLARIRDDMPIELELVDTREALKWAVKTLDDQIQTQKATLDIDDNLPLVYGLQSWIEEVWMNYLSNALKYGGSPPHIRIRTSMIGELVRFDVHDNGSGLTPEQQSKLFQHFVRLEPNRATGVGLGLAITRRIVERLGGTVSVESESGQGTTFSFTLRAVMPTVTPPKSTHTSTITCTQTAEQPHVVSTARAMG